MKWNPFKNSEYRQSARSLYLAARRRQELRNRLLLGLVAAVLLLIVFFVLSSTSGRQDETGQNKPKLFSTNGKENPQNPLDGLRLYVDPDSDAAKQAEIWRQSDPYKAEQMDKLADQPGAKWFSNAITFDEVQNYVRAANDAGATPVTVAYYIPKRDCNKYSSGGAPSEAAYYDYIDTYAKAIGTMRSIVILEPDALVHTWSSDGQGQPCLNDRERDMYFNLLSYAVDRFKSLPSTYVYIDAGNSGWSKDTADMAERLKRANVAKADGFALNVSNFQLDADTIRYGREISAQTNNKHFVMDTSRNGLGPYTNQANISFNWCNPPGRALGHYPTVQTGEPLVDAYLYIKKIGESDGEDSDPNKCFGGPKAGVWWPEYALGLVERWPKELQYGYRP